MNAPAGSIRHGAFLLETPINGVVPCEAVPGEAPERAAQDKDIERRDRRFHHGNVPFLRDFRALERLRRSGGVFRRAGNFTFWGDGGGRRA